MRRLTFLFVVLIGMIVNPALGEIRVIGIYPIPSASESTESEFTDEVPDGFLSWQLRIPKLDGSWKVTEFWQNGKRTAGDELAGLHYSFADDTMQWGYNELGVSDQADGAAPARFKFKLDASTTPMQMDAQLRDGTRRAIHSIDKDTLVICAFIARKKTGRPKTITTVGKHGDGLNILVLTRVPDSTTWVPDKHGILRDPVGRPVGWWGVNGPETTTANRR